MGDAPSQSILLVELRPLTGNAYLQAHDQSSFHAILLQTLHQANCHESKHMKSLPVFFIGNLTVDTTPSSINRSVGRSSRKHY